MVSALKSADYEEKLKELSITTFEERRHQADMLYVYKILTGREDVDKDNWFTMATKSIMTTRVATHWLNMRELFLSESIRTLEQHTRTHKGPKDSDRF